MRLQPRISLAPHPQPKARSRILAAVQAWALLWATALGEAAAQAPRPPANVPAPTSTLLVHLTTPPSTLSDAYVRAEEQARRETQDRWLPLGSGLGSIRPSWWRQRLSWNMTGPRLDLREEVQYSLSYRPAAHTSGAAPIQCGTAPAADPPGLLHIHHHATLSLTSSYGLDAAGTGVDLTWKSHCSPRGLNQDPTRILAPHFKAERDRITTLLLDTLRADWSIKADVAEVWARLSEPILLDDATKTWILLSPEASQAGQLGLHNGQLAATVGVLIRPTLIRGKSPVATTSPLPAARDGIPASRLHAVFDIPVPFEEADARLREALVGQQFGQGLGTLTIQAVHFTPVGHRAQVELEIDLAGLTTVPLQLTGTPVLDEPSQTVSFTQLDYALPRRSAVTELAESLLHDEFRRQLEKRLTINLAPRLEEARRQANETFNREWKGGRVEGHLRALRIKRLTMEPTQFMASLLTDGEIHYTVASKAAAPQAAQPQTRR